MNATDSRLPEPQSLNELLPARTEQPFDATAAHGRIDRLLAGRYRLEQLLGQGAMGEVYRAFDYKRQERCAVKMVYPRAAFGLQAHRRFENEGKVVTRLFHPNIVEVHEFCKDSDGTRFLVMELLEGISLHSMLQRGERLPLWRVLEIARGAGTALQYAHDMGIVHRDINPSNIFLSRQRSADGQRSEVVKVLDFGLAKIRHALPHRVLPVASHDEPFVTCGIVVGTPAYLPPESALGQGASADPRSDQWALAVVVYQLLAGQLPFERNNIDQLYETILSEVPRPLRPLCPDLPAHVYVALEIALSRSCAGRFASVKDFLRALENLPPLDAPLDARWESPPPDVTLVDSPAAPKPAQAADAYAAAPETTNQFQAPGEQPPDVLKTVRYSAQEFKLLAQRLRSHDGYEPAHLDATALDDQAPHEEDAHDTLSDAAEPPACRLPGVTRLPEGRRFPATEPAARPDVGSLQTQLATGDMPEVSCAERKTVEGYRRRAFLSDPLRSLRRAAPASLLQLKPMRLVLFLWFGIIGASLLAGTVFMARQLLPPSSASEVVSAPKPAPSSNSPKPAWDKRSRIPAHIPRERTSGQPQPQPQKNIVRR